jgi:SAM-dependent methyltransferase
VTAAPPGGIDRDYFEGDNYVDHEAQSAGEAADILGWLRRYGAAGPALEVGCATGNVLLALEEAGIPAFGLDISEWAVERANQRLGRERAWVCDVGTAGSGGFPPAIQAQAPFRTLVLWSVFEHFQDPFATLERLGRLAAPGATLLLQTTNAESLTHALFGPDWEGYFDWTHLGIDRVGVRSLREGLPRLGWRIEHLHTHLLWTGSADPTHAALRDGYALDARFRRLLAERDLGDLILIVARKEEG